MSNSASKQTVFILGGTGTTGASVVNGLLDSGKYHVVIGVRPASLSKPEVLKLQERGVEVRAVELDAAPATIDAALKGVDTVIFATPFSETDKQPRWADAAKRVGVKRFVPDDWATPCERGVRKMYDQKASIRDYIKSIGLGYTFIDVGLWAVLALPEDKSESQDIFLPSKSHRITGSGDVKCAITHIPDIGRFVAEIIADDHTLNQYVFCWGDEKTQNEVWDIARKVKLELTGEPLKATPKIETEEEVLQKVKDAKDGTVDQMGSEYVLSICIRGDNTVENAKKPGYGGAMDARELYPNLKVLTVEEVARLVYGKSA
ncbi:NAD(P)-binding protein [Schizopora paradoxa]|uniref:NAD(P)-binding protein n=1 Tax=Schizopora paradoxa TaxID=27342 RepID=A0A0H2S4W8_9AGAM|nr:NAD(P)-binding protein [Schizopora paradoxa]